MILGYLIKISDQYTRERNEQALKFVNDLKPEVYLDCGCDEGELTKKLANKAKAKRVMGFDINPTAIQKTKSRGIEVYKQDLNKAFGLEDDSVDLITALETIEHLYDVDTFISEVWRVLKPKGSLIISTENLASWHNIFALLFGNQPYTGPYISKKFILGHRPCACFWKEKERRSMPSHLSVMTAKTLVQLLESYGFGVTLVNAIGYYPFPLGISSFITKLDPSHSAFVVVRAVKNDSKKH